MKRNVFGIFALSIFLMSVTLSSALLTEEMEVVTEIKSQELGVSVTDNVFIQNAIRGYKTGGDFDVNNTGTSDLVFYTSLYGWDWVNNGCNNNPDFCLNEGISDAYPEILSNLKIGYGSGEDFVEGFSWQVNKPSEIGGILQKTFELVLDLTELESGGDDTESAYILFDVMPA